MNSRYDVTPYVQSGRRSYIGTFYNASGKRVTRGLGTSDADLAKVICAGLVLLRNAGATLAGPIPAGVHPDAHRLYFMAPAAKGAAAESIELTRSRFLALADTARAMNEKTGGNAAGLIHALELLTVRAERDAAHVDRQAAQFNLEKEQAAHVALQHSALGRAVAASAAVPPLDAAMVQFRAHMQSTVNSRHAGEMVRLAEKFIASLPADVKTLAAVRVDHVAEFLDKLILNSGTTKPAGYRKHMRVNLGRLLNWSAKRWEHPSPMVGVPPVPKSAVLRERGDIHFHALTAVEGALAAMPSAAWFKYKKLDGDGDAAAREGLTIYWRALVAMLAYAGVQLAELAWLRRADVEISGGRGRLWITTVADNEDADVIHALKTEHRRRHVDIHPRLLLPRLQAHLERLDERAFHVFPVPHVTRRRARVVASGSADRWLVGTLSTVLRGHHGGADPVKRPPAPGLLPADMNAKSLRRTFGSLLIRSGKTTAQVAAAMGNTENVVRDHYARILGCEVDVDF